MTKSRSRKSYRDEAPPDLKRRYSILPSRAIQDRDNNVTDIKVLGAICMHTNSHGIAWPSITTLARHVGCTIDSVSVVTQRLVKRGYIRKLKPRPYKVKAKARRQTTRYQVLFDGDETPLPTLEDFRAPKPRLVAEHDGDDEASLTEPTGFERENPALSRSLAQSFVRAVQAATGELRLPDRQRATADRLALAGVTPEQVAEATRQAVLEARSAGRSAPQTLEQVAERAGLG
jgi:hypothetical protein